MFSTFHFNFRPKEIKKRTNYFTNLKALRALATTLEHDNKKPKMDRNSNNECICITIMHKR